MQIWGEVTPMINVYEFITKNGVTLEFSGDYIPGIGFTEYYINHNNDPVHEIMDDNLLIEIENEMEDIALSELSNPGRRT